MKKKRSARLKAKKKKRQRARNKKEREKDNIVDQPNYDSGNTEEEPKPKKDSLHYAFSSPAEDKYIIIKFIKTGQDKKDSILVKYPDDGDEISVYDKQILKNYTDSNKIEKISLVEVWEHVGTKEDDKHRNKHTSPIKRNLANYFIQLGIPPEKINLNRK